jgi:hypothetical protein
MEIPIRRGRDFDARDTRESPWVAVMSESFARRYWPDADPLGRRFQIALAKRTAAGVVPGVALAYAAGRALESLLVSVNPGDGVTFLGVVSLCLVMTTAGCLLRAPRAGRLDPIGAIRAE